MNTGNGPIDIQTQAPETPTQRRIKTLMRQYKKGNAVKGLPGRGEKAARIKFNLRRKKGNRSRRGNRR